MRRRPSEVLPRPRGLERLVAAKPLRRSILPNRRTTRWFPARAESGLEIRIEVSSLLPRPIIKFRLRSALPRWQHVFSDRRLNTARLSTKVAPPASTRSTSELWPGSRIATGPEPGLALRFEPRLGFRLKFLLESRLELRLALALKPSLDFLSESRLELRLRLSLELRPDCRSRHRSRPRLKPRLSIRLLVAHRLPCHSRQLRRSRPAPPAGLQLTLRGETQRMYLFRLQLPQLARLKIQHQRTISDPTNLLHMMPDLLEHLAQFPVAALDDDHFIPGIVPLPHLPYLRRSSAYTPGECSRTAFFDDYSATQRVKHVLRRLPGYLHQVGLLHSRRRLGQLVSQFAVISHQQQAFAQVVQPPHGVQTFPLVREELHHRRTSLGIAHRGHIALRLVQHKVANPLRTLQQLAIHANVVPRRIGLGSQLHHHFAVDLNETAKNQLFSLAP